MHAILIILFIYGFMLFIFYHIINFFTWKNRNCVELPTSWDLWPSQLSFSSTGWHKMKKFHISKFERSSLSNFHLRGVKGSWQIQSKRRRILVTILKAGMSTSFLLNNQWKIDAFKFNLNNCWPRHIRRKEISVGGGRSINTMKIGKITWRHRQDKVRYLTCCTELIISVRTSLPSMVNRS